MLRNLKITLINLLWTMQWKNSRTRITLWPLRQLLQSEKRVKELEEALNRMAMYNIQVKTGSMKVTSLWILDPCGLRGKLSELKPFLNDVLVLRALPIIFQEPVEKGKFQGVLSFYGE